MTKQFKEEARKNGIVPGAEVQWESNKSFTVPNYDEWNFMPTYSGDLVAWMERDGAPHGYCWIHRYGTWAKVIKPSGEIFVETIMGAVSKGLKLAKESGEDPMNCIRKFVSQLRTN